MSEAAGHWEQHFLNVYERHHRAVLAYAARRVDAPADAADILAETFLVTWRRIEDVPGGSRTLPWLLGVARHVLANYYRSNRRRLALVDRLREDLSALPTSPPPSPVPHPPP